MVSIYLKGESPAFVVNKDPDATLDYTWDWTEYLAEISDTIQSFTVTPDATLSLVGASVVSGTKVVAYISGGQVGVPASAVCRITTVDGRIDDRTIHFNIIQK